MMRKRNIITAMVAAMALAAIPAADALARGGGGGGMGGGHGGMGGGRGMGGGGMGFAHSASFAGGARSFAGPRSVAFTGNRVAFAHNRFAFAHNNFRFRHHFRNRFFFAGAPLAYASYYDDGCYARVWTAWGWRWSNVCSY